MGKVLSTVLHAGMFVFLVIFTVWFVEDVVVNPIVVQMEADWRASLEASGEDVPMLNPQPPTDSMIWQARFWLGVVVWVVFAGVRGWWRWTLEEQRKRHEILAKITGEAEKVTTDEPTH